MNWSNGAERDESQQVSGGFGGSDGFDEWGGSGGDIGFSPTPDPGAALPPFRPSLTMQRTRFAIDLPDAATLTVDIDHAAGQASLYRDGRHERTAEMPVRFPVGSDRIEVVASRYGMQRIHLVRADGSQRQLEPAPGTPEYWRARFSRRYPKWGRALAIGAVVVLVVNLAILAPQLLEVLTHIPLWSDRFAPFVSPITLPAWTNTVLTVVAALAGIERALTFRHSRVLDVETDGIEA
jgi:hypothetical protein